MKQRWWRRGRRTPGNLLRSILLGFLLAVFLGCLVLGVDRLEASPGFFLVSFGLILWMLLHLSRKPRRRILELRLRDLDRLSGQEFENWIQVVLVETGFEIEDRAAAGDYGVDVLATYRGVRIGIQAKRYRRNVGNAAVQEVHAGADYHSCDLAAVITQSGFTRAARAQASRLPRRCVLIGRSELPGFIEILQDEARTLRS